MPPVGFEPTISAGEGPKTYALDRAATGTGGRALLAVLNLYERIKIRVETFDTNHSVVDSTHGINRRFDPEAS